MAISSMKPYNEKLAKYIPEQYKQSEKLRGLIAALQKQFDDLDDAFFEMLQALDPETAIGPALDYLGAIVGVARVPGETDDSYRIRIVSRSFLASGLLTPKAVRAFIKFVSGCDRVGLYPDWPAAMYYVLDGGTEANLSNIEKETMTSGASLTRGTFLMGEYEDGDEVEFGYLVFEDNEQPIVCDYRYPDTEYVMTDADGNGIINDQGEAVVGIDYLT